jgi:two-component system sensor histidine kinase DegS
MIVAYLENLQKQYLEEKFSIEKEMNDLQIHSKENAEFIRMLEDTNDPNFESFSPREVNSVNKQKISELKEEQKELQNAIQEARMKYSESIKKVDEIASVLKVARKTDNIDTFADSESSRIELLETQENERQRISRELHDSTVQNLTSLVHKTELCSKLVESDPVRCKLELLMMSKIIREIISDTRQMIYNLRPMSFDDIGLDVTIERALDKLESSENKKISFVVEGESYPIKPVIGITLLRIIQEACSNAIRHADSSVIEVKLIYGTDRVSVTIEDNGNGFDIQKIKEESRDNNSGFGLSMMKERVYLLSGNINIASKLNYGTKITVEVPINNKEDL